jgi:MiaB/RimO family radical SAM methylthiotransferase
VDQISRAVRDGVKEIWVTAQDTGAYGLDIGSNLATLLKEMCHIEGKFIMRIGMMNPQHAFNMLGRLINAYKDGKIFKFLHLPLQSGNDNVLRRMNRPYTTETFKRTINVFRGEITDLTLATDIICGFPSEDEEAFEDTLKVIAEVEPDIVNVSKFFPRPGTAAAGMKQLPSQVVKRRSKRLNELRFRVSHKRNQRWLNWVGEVLIDEKGKKGAWIGRNLAYKPVVIKSDKDLTGLRVEVRVVRVFQTYLEGEMISIL